VTIFRVVWQTNTNIYEKPAVGTYSVMSLPLQVHGKIFFSKTLEIANQNTRRHIAKGPGSQ
jgi:hypothetical protein